MGSGKKKDKKKKRKRDSYDEESSPRKSLKEDKRSGTFTAEDSRLSKTGRQILPETEEYLGKETIQETQNVTSPPEHDKKNNYNKYLSKNKSKERSPYRSLRKKELSPPPIPPGIDWPFEAPKAPNRTRSPLSDYESDWIAKEDRNRDRDYQDEVDRKYQAKLNEDTRKAGELYNLTFLNIDMVSEIIIKYYHLSINVNSYQLSKLYPDAW